MKKELNEQQLKNIVSTSVRRVLREIGEPDKEQEDDRLAKKMEMTLNMLMGMFGAACFKEEDMCHNFDRIEHERYIYIDYGPISLDQMKELANNLMDSGINEQGFIDSSRLEAFFELNLRWNRNDIVLFYRIVQDTIDAAFNKALNKMPQLAFIRDRFDDCSFGITPHPRGEYDCLFTAWIDVKESRSKIKERKQKELNKN